MSESRFVVRWPVHNTPPGVTTARRYTRPMGLFNRILRAGEGRKLKLLETIPPEVNALEPEMERLSDADLAHKTVEFRERLARVVDLNDTSDKTWDPLQDALADMLPEAFAVVRESARRVIGQRHFDVQVMGGSALHFGWVAEMKTGEGKTLVATLPLYLNALAGYGCHLVTVNDYLARRDAEWMGQIYRFLGLDVGVVIPEVYDYEAKRAAYRADVTYGTN